MTTAPPAPFTRQTPTEHLTSKINDTCPFCLNTETSNELLSHELTLEDKVMQCWAHKSCLQNYISISARNGDDKTTISKDNKVIIRCISCQNMVTLDNATARKTKGLQFHHFARPAIWGASISVGTVISAMSIVLSKQAFSYAEILLGNPHPIISITAVLGYCSVGISGLMATQSLVNYLADQADISTNPNGNLQEIICAAASFFSLCATMNLISPPSKPNSQLLRS